jgi:K+-transporting ATPase ATPase B chain
MQGRCSEMQTKMRTNALEVKPWKTRRKGAISIWDPAIMRRAIPDSFKKLDPRVQVKNPVMFVVEIGSVITTIECVRLLFTAPTAAFPRPQLTYETLFVLAVAVWLWFTVVFANFAEAMAEGRGKAQADTLRRARTTTMAKRLASQDRFGKVEEVAAPDLRKGDLVLVEAGDVIPGDGDVVEGVASVDESAITGESAPVIRESGGDRSAVTGGTRVLSDWIIVRISANPGETFLDRMIALVEGARRQRTPNEIALNILIASLTIIFVLVVVTLEPFAIYSGQPVSVTTLIALLVCLIPTTIGGLLSAIGIAGMDRLVQRNVLAMSGRAVEAAGDVDVLLLDKTGTITLGNRQATRFVPLAGVDERDLAHAAMLSSLADETPEGRSIVALAQERYGFTAEGDAATTFIPFSAMTRMSGVDIGATPGNDGARPGQAIRKGAADAVAAYVAEHGGEMARNEQLREIVDSIARAGSTPLVVAETAAGSNGRGEQARVLGVIELKDIIKGGMRARFEELRRMGIRTIMITGDNPLTASAIAKEAGVDDFLAQATPETKMKLIREQQAGGHLVAMTGDGTNDAPALAQADVGVAMNTGTQAAKEAANMVDLDSNPTKLIEVVEVGKQLLMTRGALTTFSIANDVAKYFAIIPAAFSVTYPQLEALNIMHLATPHSAVLSAVIFNALIIIALIPLALRGVKYRPIGAGPLLRRNLLIYGLGGIIIPFAGIKLIDLILTLLHLTL